MGQYFGLLTKAGTPTNGVNEVQTVTVTATGGTFTLTFDAQTTAAIAYNATAAAVQTALQALSTINSGGVLVTGAAGGPYTCTFAGSLAGLNQNQMTSDATNLTPGGSTAVVATATAGVRGDFRGSEPGQVVLDTTNRIIYENSGTKATPVWTEISSV